MVGGFVDGTFVEVRRLDGRVDGRVEGFVVHLVVAFVLVRGLELLGAFVLVRFVEVAFETRVVDFAQS